MTIFFYLAGLIAGFLIGVLVGINGR